MFLKWLEKRGSWRMIKRNGDPYLKRFYLFNSKWFMVDLHNILASDPDDLHDHPSWNITVLTGGAYLEHELDGTVSFRTPGFIRLRSPEQLHRLEVPEGYTSAWSIFIRFKKIRTWGFLTSEGWIKASEYSRENVDIQGRDFELKGRLFPRVIWRTK